MTLLNPHESFVCSQAVQFKKLYAIQPQLFVLILADERIGPSAKKIAITLANKDTPELTLDEFKTMSRFREWHANNIKLGEQRRRRSHSH